MHESELPMLKSLDDRVVEQQEQGTRPLRKTHGGIGICDPTVIHVEWLTLRQ